MWYNCLFPFPANKGNRRAAKKLAQWENEEAYQDMFCYLLNLYLQLFEWKNLPETCNERALEITLFYHGNALFFADSEIYNPDAYPVFKGDGTDKFFHTPVALGQGLNIYYEHIKRRAYSYNYNKEFDITNSVLIRNNRLMTPSVDTLMIMTRRLVNGIRTIESAADHYKTPYLIGVDETEVKTFEEIETMRQENQVRILTTKSFNPEAIKVMPTGIVHGTLTELWDHYHNFENLVFTRLGLNNANTDKKERLISSEVNANNQVIYASVDEGLLSRKQAAEEINKMFGLNIQVDLRYKGDSNDGELYNDPAGLSRDGEPTV